MRSWLLGVCLCGAACAASGESVFRGELGRIRGFDPAQASDIATAMAVSQVYEGLLQVGYRARPYRVEPNLAAELPVWSEDGLTCTIRLRPGLRFQDDPCFPGGRGRVLTAADVVYSIQRVADPRTGATGYWAFRGHIAGLDAFREACGMGSASNVARAATGLEAVDAQTLRFHLTHPWPQFEWVLTLPAAFVVPHEAVTTYGADFARHPVGSGPYVLQHWRPNYSLDFIRNPQWAATGRRDLETGRESAGPVPHIDRVVWNVVGDASTAWLLFLRGALDVVGLARDNGDAVLTAEGRLTGDLAARGVRLSAAPALDTYYIGFNMDDPVVGTNRALRQALTCAFDRAAWLRYHQGRVVEASGPVPPGIEGHLATPSPFAFDLERARRLLTQAGYPGGADPLTGRRLELRLELGAADAETRETAELLVHFMDRIGLSLMPSYNNRPTFFRKLEQRRAQLFALNWAADYPDAENFLQLFYGPNASPGPNRTNYRNPEFDRLYEQALTTRETAARAALYRRMAEIVQTDCPWIFRHHPVTYALYRQRLRNYAPHDFPYGMIKYYECGE